MESICPRSELPTVTKQLTINGHTRSGAAAGAVADATAGAAENTDAAGPTRPTRDR